MLAAILPWLWDKIAWWEIVALFVLWCWIYNKTMSQGAVFGSGPTIWERFDEINGRLYAMEQNAEGEAELEEWLDAIERRLGKLERPQTNDDLPLPTDFLDEDF